jgi:hypothetical protein
MIVVAIVLAALAGGSLVTYAWDDESPLTIRLAMGACLGLVALGLIGFAIASIFGFTPGSLAIAAIAAASPLLLLMRRPWRAAVAADVQRAGCRLREAMTGHARPAVTNAVLVLTAFIPLTLIFSGAMYTAADGVYTSIFVNRNDLPLHIAIIQGFLDGGNFPPQHPEFAGARLTYPFLADFIAAQFALAGLTIERAILVENLIIVLALLVLLHWWARTLTGSQAAARFAVVIVLAGSGLGWLMMLRDSYASGSTFLAYLSRLPWDYTINTNDLQWGNLTTTMLVTQRSIMLGVPLFAIACTWLWRAVQDETDDRRRLRLMAGAGIVVGLLPLAHPHTFGVVGGSAALLCILFPQRQWATFFVAAVLLAVPQLWWASRGSMVDNTNFVSWHLGWTNKSDAIWWFWFKNTGIFIPLLGLMLCAGRRLGVAPPMLLRFYAPFLIWFIVPQLMRLAPRAQGNLKVLVYWYIASAPLVALLLAWLWHRGRVFRLASIGIVLSLTLATGLDAWRILSGAGTVRVFDARSVAFARLVQQATPPGAVIAHAPTTKHPVFLTGRLSLLGNLRHVRSHGLNYRERQADVRRIYAGAPDAAALLEHYDVDYVVVGPAERIGLPVNDNFLQRYPVVAEAGGLRLYQITSPDPRAVSKASMRGGR